MRTIELAEGITATVADDVSSQTIAAIREIALKCRHRDRWGYMSNEPMKIEDGVDYETRNVVCASCGARMPCAPWPTNSTQFQHRPRCGKCNSPMTVPEMKTPEPCPPATT